MKYLFFLLCPILLFSCQESSKIYTEDDAIKHTALLADHQTIAVFESANYYLCPGLTSACPDRCGASGVYAHFKIMEYQKYEKLDKYGEDKQEYFSYHVSDYDRKPLKNQKWLMQVAALPKGQKVFLHWQHRYGTARFPNILEPIYPIIAVEKQ